MEVNKSVKNLDGGKKLTKKELKKLAKRAEYEKELASMGSKVDGQENGSAEKRRKFTNIQLRSAPPERTLTSRDLDGGGIGAAAELGEQFTVSQQVHSAAQMSQMENAVDIKVLLLKSCDRPNELCFVNIQF